MSRFASALFAASALAAVTTAPALAQTAFDGPYVGAYTGYAFGSNEAETGTTKTDLDADGWTYGAYVGYGKTFDRLYLGAEAEFGGTDIEGDGTSGTFVGALDTKESFGLSARAGYLFADNILGYARLGWQQTDVRAVALSGATASSFKDELDGIRYGVGSEIALTPNILARVEYNYTDYEKAKFNLGTQRVGIQPDSSEVRVGIAYRF